MGDIVHLKQPGRLQGNQPAVCKVCNRQFVETKRTPRPVMGARGVHKAVVRDCVVNWSFVAEASLSHFPEGTPPTGI